MILTDLTLTNFRNYQRADVSFHMGANVLYGKNGQGKTNILESIYYLAITKSFRTNTDKDLILNKEEFFRIQGEFQTIQGRKNKSFIAYSTNNGKRLVHNGHQVQKFAEYIGTTPIVLLAPSDLQISQSGPQQRRRFLDIMLSQSSQLYLHHLFQYRRSLKQRNAILQSEQPDGSLLRSWEEALAKNGSELIRKRLEATEKLDKLVKQFYQQLSGGQDKVKLIYRSSVANNFKENIEDRFREAFEDSREKDLRLETTTIGPHRDDLLLLINGRPLRIVGSQGEHKTFVIALKMAEFHFLKNVQDEPPILLFDDIFGELDAERIKNMIESLSQIGQVFITTTSAHFFGKVKSWEQNAHFYEINQGNITMRDSVWQGPNH